jgi:copper chaperone CopZ
MNCITVSLHQQCNFTSLNKYLKRRKMETTQFKTNIKCSGCITTVTPVLNNIAGADNWKVDLASPDRVLSISAVNIDKNEVRNALGKVGYKAEALQ